MGEIQFSCPHCQAKLHVVEQYAGRAVKCAKCGQVSTVPAPMATQPNNDEVVTAEDVTSVRQKQPLGGELAVEPFAAQLAQAFMYPFKGSGILLLIIATVLFVVLRVLAAIMICAMDLLLLLLMGYMCAYYISVIGSSAAGEEELPDWPDLSSIWDDIIRPLLLLAAAIIVSAMPLIICVFIAGGWAAMGSTVLMNFWVLVGVAIGLLYLPMSLLAIAMYDSVLALNPVTIIGSIFKIPLQYLMACVLFFLVYYANVQVKPFLVQIPWVGLVIQVLVSLYLMMVLMRILGLIYYANSKKLGWFEEK